MILQSRRPVIGGNWKMNTTFGESTGLATELAGAIGDAGGVDIIVFPPFTNISAVSAMLDRTNISVGGQDVFWAEKGAYTGEISPEMLKSVGATWVITGHSERRHIIGESNDVINRKTRCALGAGLSVILAVGETSAERNERKTELVLAAQLSGSLHEVEVSDAAGIVIAYEPVWAIGTGLTATPEQAQEAHAFIRSRLCDRFGYSIAAETRIQYGGSVTPVNAASLLALPDVDGALVGGASLRTEDFAAIIRSQALVSGSQSLP